MGQVEGYGNGGHPLGREPLIAQVAIGPHGYAVRGELGIELADPRLQLALLQPDAEIAEAEAQQFLILERLPGPLGGHLYHNLHPTETFQNENVPEGAMWRALSSARRTGPSWKAPTTVACSRLRWPYCFPH